MANGLPKNGESFKITELMAFGTKERKWLNIAQA
jgi:hypothetical protein